VTESFDSFRTHQILFALFYRQHFDDIYVKLNPVPYKTEILDKLEYVSLTLWLKGDEILEL